MSEKSGDNDDMINKFFRYGLIDLKMRKTRLALKASAATLQACVEEARLYDQRLRPYRARLKETVQSLIRKIDAYGAERDQMIFLSLIAFSAIGAKMVEKAEPWLKYWSSELGRQGYAALAASYLHHANEEVGHDEWHRRDVRTLVDMYKARFGVSLDKEKILSMGNATCVEDYRVLSEETLAGPHAILSLAELYETEIMALELAPDFIRYCVGELGFEVLKGLGFLRGHVVADVDHIRENIDQLNGFLSTQPQRLDELVMAGEQTIVVYETYFTELVALADQLLRQTTSDARLSA